MTADFIGQLMIVGFGVTAVVLTQQPSPRMRRWAPVFGLAGQPAWLWVSFEAGQWGIFAASLAYTGAWLSGVWQLRIPQ